MAESMTQQQKIALETISSGTATEAIGGAAAIVLTILGLSNIAPVYMLSIATIAVGVGLLFQGSAIAAEYSDLISKVGGEELHSMNLGDGLSIEITAGGIGIGLGILSLVFVVPQILTPIAGIVLGCGIALSSRTISRLNDLKIMTSDANDTAQKIAREAVNAASGAQVIVGLGAITLGILSLTGVSPMILTMIALLSLGFSTLLSGLSTSGKALSSFAR